MKPYDLVVIGTGVAASAAAYRCRTAGWSVAVIDHVPFGGTCALRGCDPKKVLVGVADAVDHARRMRGKGIGGSEPIVDWPALMAFKRTFTDPVPGTTEHGFADKGIDTYHGVARFRDRHSLQVGEDVLTARFVLIASGAVPAPLGIAGDEHVVSSTDFMELQHLPGRIVFIGGGYIAAEFSHVAARAGARVTVLQRGARMLKAFDADVVGWLMQKSRAIGIDVRLETRVERIEKRDTALAVHAVTDGKPQSFDADLVVHAAGRVPDLEALDLPAAGIQSAKGRLQLNEFLQSVSNPTVYAAGDAATKGPPLTPVASHDGTVVAANMLNGNQRRPDYRGVPSVCFTIPPLASVGMTEEKARDQGCRFRVNCQNASAWYTARRVAESTYGFKVLIDEASDRLLGAHVIGPGADEVINVFALAIRQGIKAKELRDSIFTYPSGASDIGHMLA
jgi:glutathione reductase (NADPH)